VEFGFDESRILSPEELAQRKQWQWADVNFTGTVSACGAPSDLPSVKIEEEDDVVVAEAESEQVSTVPMMKV
jgi:anaerobic magnesium-protoporphyrin IX monomethyl ester cyclase